MTDLRDDIGYNPASLIWEHLSNTDFRATTTSFQIEHAAIGSSAVDLLNAAKRLWSSAPPATIENGISTLRKLSATIERTGLANAHPRLWLDAWEHHLIGLTTKANTKRTNFHRAYVIIREALRLRGESFFRANPFAHAAERENRDYEVDIFASGDLDTAVQTARNRALEIMRDFEELPEPYWPFLTAMRRIAIANGGMLPFSSQSRELARLTGRMSYNRLSPDRVVQVLSPGVRTLIPFIFLITYKLAANVSSVTSMRVDCMTAFENELTGLQQKVKLFKPRAGDISEYVVRDRGTLSVPWLIRSLLALTRMIRAAADRQHQMHLFLYRSAARQSVEAVSLHTVYSSFESFKAMDCAGVDGTLKSLRSTRALAEYAKAPDPFRIKRILKHKHLSTTVRYLRNRIGVETDAAIIANVQRSIVAITESRGSSESAESTILASHACLKPDAVDHGHDESGFCAHLLWPLNSRHFWLSKEPRAVAFLLRHRDALRDAKLRLSAERFERASYAALLDLIERKHLPTVPADILAAAATIQAELPPMVID
jgi:hypothetical protein